MSATIRAILSGFSATRERAVLCIGGNAHSKANSRRKLFDQWYIRYRKETFVKLDVLLGADENDVSCSAGLLSRLNNPYFTPLSESFKRAVFGPK